MVSHFSDLFQRLREPTKVFHRFVLSICFVCRSGKSQEKKGGNHRCYSRYKPVTIEENIYPRLLMDTRVRTEDSLEYNPKF